MPLQGAAIFGDLAPEILGSLHTFALESGNYVCIIGYLNPILSPFQLYMGKNNRSYEGIQLSCNFPIRVLGHFCLSSHCFLDLLPYL